MPESFWSLPELSYPPLRPPLKAFMRRIREEYEHEVDFVVLFGSAARGEAGPGSDLDLLVGLKHDGSERFLDRIGRFGDLAPSVEAFPYYPSELALMLKQLHFTLLEAVDHGKVLWDCGGWAPIARSIQAEREAGGVLKIAGGWSRPALLRAHPPRSTS